jgi:hypothetical protein
MICDDTVNEAYVWLCNNGFRVGIQKDCLHDILLFIQLYEKDGDLIELAKARVLLTEIVLRWDECAYILKEELP